MITRYIIALHSDPVSYYDGGTDGDPSRTYFNRLSKQYPNRKFFVKYL